MRVEMPGVGRNHEDRTKSLRIEEEARHDVVEFPHRQPRLHDDIPRRVPRRRFQECRIVDQRRRACRQGTQFAVDQLRSPRNHPDALPAYLALDRRSESSFEDQPDEHQWKDHRRTEGRRCTGRRESAGVERASTRRHGSAILVPAGRGSWRVFSVPRSSSTVLGPCRGRCSESQSTGLPADLPAADAGSRRCAKTPVVEPTLLSRRRRWLASTSARDYTTL